MTADQVVKIIINQMFMVATDVILHHIFSLLLSKCMKRELEGYPLLMLVVGSLRDICFLLTAPEIYHDFRSVTAKGFVTATRDYLEKQGGSTPSTNGMITCNKDHRERADLDARLW